MANKPQGRNSFITLGENRPFTQIQLPEQKEAREQMIVDWFRLSLENQRDISVKIHEAEKNAENDFDFDVETNLGSKHLELTEFAPLEGVRGGYENAPGGFTFGEATDLICQLIKKKADHYAPKSPNLFLLIYVTHFAFQPPDDVLRLVKLNLQRYPPFFDSIFFMFPVSDAGSDVRLLFPNSEKDIQLTELKSLRVKYFSVSDLMNESSIEKG
jgi:hypothetical protein